MKRFLILSGLCMLMACMASAAPPYHQEQPQSVMCIVSSADAPTTVVADIEYAYMAYEMPAQVLETYTFYQAMPVEVRTQVFDLKMPVFRLCIHKANMFKSNLHTGWRGQNSNPLNQYDRA